MCDASDVAPSVSVVIPAFRAASTIGAALSGALMQTCADIEVVVVDDGSDDETADIVAAHRDPRVRLVRQENRGVAAARNVGVAAVRADLVAFCDADDMLLPSHLERALALVAPRTVVTTNAYWLLPGGIDPGKVRHLGRFPAPEAQRAAILQQNFVSTMSIFPRALVDEIGPFDETLRRAEDWDFWLRAVLAGYRVVHQPRPLALYRWTDDSLSAGVEEMDEAVRAVLRKAAAGNDLRPEERAYVERRLAGPDPRVLYRRAEQALRDGRYGEAAAGYAAAAELLPTERRLVWKARLVGAWPSATGRLMARRMRDREAALGFGEGHVR